MLHVYAIQDKRVVRDNGAAALSRENIVWVDLCEPTLEEAAAVERHFNLELPTPDDMREIEVTSRLYEENGVHFMTMTYIAHALDKDPSPTQVTFMTTKKTLVTLRYGEIRLISHYGEKLSHRHVETLNNGAGIFVALLEFIVDWCADILQASAATLETLGDRILMPQKSTDYKSLLMEMGRVHRLNTQMQESLVSLMRLQLYANQPLEEMKASKELKERLKSMGDDVRSLLDKAAATTTNMSFLLDATLGLVSIQQNAIIKIFSVAAVIFLPPTLIASIYGMNFEFIPELHWHMGYPFALALMIVSALLPYYFFKHKGWL